MSARHEHGDSPATLVAIAIAARRAGDRELEREIRRRLEERYGVRLTFTRPRQLAGGGEYVG
jgi:hypothetical protein